MTKTDGWMTKTDGWMTKTDGWIADADGQIAVMASERLTEAMRVGRSTATAGKPAR